MLYYFLFIFYSCGFLHFDHFGLMVCILYIFCVGFKLNCFFI